MKAKRHIVIKKRNVIMYRVRSITNTPSAHRRHINGEGVTVAFLDTGIYPHPDFEDRILAFRDFRNRKIRPYDDSGHGTHVAGICCGSGKLSGGRYAGIAPKASIVAVKVLDREGNGSKDQVVESVHWILENCSTYGIRILNVSVGAINSQKEKNTELIACMEEAWDAGIVVVAAAGNMGPENGSITAPGNSRKVITVGAYDDCAFPNGCYSGRGPTQECICKPEITAPGSNIRSCCNDCIRKRKNYCSKSGTSMAAPVVSGAVALLLQQEPDLTNVEVKMRLKNCARNLNLPKSRQGWGAIDVNSRLT